MEQAPHGFDVFNTNWTCDCEPCLSYREAVKRLVNSFSSIPARWITQLDDAPATMPMWGTVFMPTDSVDCRNIEELLRPITDAEELSGSEWQEIADTGTYAVECDGELILGINGAGYDFYTDHWAKLYEALDYQWHTPAETS